MLNSTGNQNPQFELRRNLPSLNYLLIISLGLIFVAIISSTFVYAESTTVNVEGDNYDIEYTGNGVSVTGVEADLDFISLIFLCGGRDSNTRTLYGTRHLNAKQSRSVYLRYLNLAHLV